MSKKDYPKKVTKGNIDFLIKEAKRIEEKFDKNKYYLIVGVIVVILVATGFLLSSFLFGQFVQISNFASIFPSIEHPSYIIVTSVLFITIFATISYILAKLSFPSIKRVIEHFGYPKIEEIIFSESILIGNHITKNRRIMAKNEVKFLLSSLSDFTLDFRNPKTKMYKPEIDLLIRARRSFQRMVMFSKKKNADILMNLGLAFVRDDNPEAFTNLKKLVEEVLRYGEPKGRFRGVFSLMERYPHSIKLVVTIAVIVVSVILILCGYVPLPWG